MHVLEGESTAPFRSVSMLKDDKPTAILRGWGCLHSWQLGHQGSMFCLSCPWCHTTRKATDLPAAFSNVLDAALKLNPVYNANERAWKVSEADVRRAVSLLNLPNRSRSERARIWDVYAALAILLSLKAGRARGNLVVKSKTLSKLIQVAMYPSTVRTMPVSSRKRYKFVLDAIRTLPARLSQESFSFAWKP
ncbi:hypothetical protein MUO79_02795 [Candidatus Bathyarchaeota archaeon]|nr:hypothetical protein [Candidatus Bathyarchaeota archaeon]